MGSSYVPAWEGTIHWVACPEAVALFAEPCLGHVLSVAVPKSQSLWEALALGLAHVPLGFCPWGVCPRSQSASELLVTTCIWVSQCFGVRGRAWENVDG